MRRSAFRAYRSRRVEFHLDQAHYPESIIGYLDHMGWNGFGLNQRQETFPLPVIPDLSG